MPLWLRALIRFVLGIWFRSVEIVGAQNSPRAGPLLVVANHENGLLDPMLVAGYLPLAPRFLGKSTLWKIPVLWPFLVAARVLPVQRKQDQGEGADMSKNAEMFQKVADALNAGAVISLFPEGESHNEPGMLPLKTGAARMCLSGPVETKFLPVGIAFENKHRFRGRALLVVGEVFDPAPLRTPGADPRAVSHAITDAVAAALKKVTINLPTWEDRKLLERAVEISRADDESLEARVRHLKNFAEAWEALRVSHPEEVARLRAQVARYDRELRLLRMSDEDVRARYRPISVANWTLRFVRLFLLRLPMGVLGAVLHAIPYQIPRAIAKAKAEEADQPASYKLMAGFVIYPVWWLLLAAVAFLLRGAEIAAGVLVLAPISAWVALRWMEQGFTLGEQARSWFLRGRRAALLEEMRAQRAEIAAGIGALEKTWRASGASRQGATTA
ncbi:MAG TPA: 1-acyl-sn-glycerol-3-phosphate acyltransferase [bacterium]|nr:1-acyl-sn-glycerol-3-phosphate acyltransferase [bacterium]